SEFLDEKVSIETFKELILKYVFDVEDVKDVPQYELTDEDWENVHKISENRYQKWEWNFGKSPKFNVQQSHKFALGLLGVSLNLKNGIIDNCIIYGDFFGLGDVSVLENKLRSVSHERKAIEEALKDIDVPYYLGKISE